MLGQSVEAVTPEPERPILQLVPDDELRLREVAVVPSVVPNLLTVGAWVLYADPGLGKSILAQALEHHLAYGRPFGGWEVDEPQRCLVVDFEGDEGLTQERGFNISPFGTVASDLGQPLEGGGIVHVFDLDGKDVWERTLILRAFLDEEATAGRPFRYVRIDTLGDFFGPKPRDCDAYAWSKPIMTELNRMATDRNLAVLLVHHTNKSGQYSGSVGIGGGGAGVMRLTRNPDTEFESYLESEKVRRGAPFRYALIQSPDDGTWAFTDEITPSQAQAAGTNRLLVDTLTQRGPLTRQELQSTLYDLPKTTLRGSLDRLARKRVIRYYRGRWEVVPDGVTTPEPLRVCAACHQRMVVSDPGATVHPTCASAEPEPEDPTSGPELASGLQMMKDALEASRMKPFPRIPPAGRDMDPWRLMTERMAGEHRWELMLDLERTRGRVAVLDRNGSYPSAAGSVLVAPNALTRTGPLDVRGDRAGIFLVSSLQWWTDASIGHPFGRLAEAPGPWWITTPHLAFWESYAAKSVIPAPVILDSWTGRGTGGLFTAFSKQVQEARLAAREAGDAEAYARVKRGSSIAIRCLWPKAAASPFWRPDWLLSIKAEAAIRHWIRAYQAVQLGATLVRLGSVDEAAFLAPDDATQEWVPEPYVLGGRYGQVKHKDDVLVAGVKTASPLTLQQWSERGRRARG